MPNPEKVKKVAALTDLFKASPSVAVTDYVGLTVADMTVLRKELREAQIKYLVAKNTLLRLAAKDAGTEMINEFLEGPTAIAFTGDDPSRMAKILYDFGKDHQKPEIKALVIDGVLYSGADTERIAKLPSRDELIAMMIGTIEAPIQEIAGAVEAPVQDFLMTIEALEAKAEN